MAVTQTERLEQRAAAAYLEGRDAESQDLWARAHQDRLAAGDAPRAIRCAFWLVFGLMQRGEHARASGWLARAQRLAESVAGDFVERGYLLFPVGVQTIFAGDPHAAIAILAEAAAIGERFQDIDLITLARNAEGRARIRGGDVEAGIRLLDEAMTAIETGDVCAAVAGDVYCSMIEACHETFDLQRAHQWTSALSRWCETQPRLVAYRGQCLTRRAEMLQMRGAWNEAATDAEQACARLSEPPPPQRAVGAALYQRAELHRLRGDLDKAEELYREAGRWDTKPRPGLALLRHVQGRADAALSTIRAHLADAQHPTLRAPLLAACTEIALGAHDVVLARAAADELSSIATQFRAPLLAAQSAHATALVMLAEGTFEAALREARRALALCQQLDAVFAAARARVLVARAAQRLGDAETATFEVAAARTVFEQLGAQPELDALEELDAIAAPAAGNGLTAREVQVLRLIAQGHTNRRVAEALFISEKTVARHVSNIFFKLRLSNRAAAAAYAFQHGIT